MGVLTNTHPTKSEVVTLSYEKYWMIALTPHFKVWEFRCKDCSRTVKIDWFTVNALEAAREFFDKAIIITSAYRTPSYNAKIGGASGSLHTTGQAADCYISGQSPSLLAKFFEAYGMKGIGCYYDDSFVHVDSRANKFFWKNQSTTAVSTHLPTIRSGSTGQDVKDLQFLLNKAGAFLDVDGVFGKNTNKEVKNFQAAKGLVIDGVVGPKTWGKLLTK